MVSELLRVEGARVIDKVRARRRVVGTSIECVDRVRQLIDAHERRMRRRRLPIAPPSPEASCERPVCPAVLLSQPWEELRSMKVSRTPLFDDYQTFYERP